MKLSSQLLEAAKAAREKSHSPYSGHKVGAAIRTKSGQIFNGCNVENSSYGGTVCAERVAIFKAVSEIGKFELAEIVVVVDAPDPWPPCGFCRQVIAEFVRDPKALPVHSANLKGVVKSTDFQALFPDAFTPDHLSK